MTALRQKVAELRKAVMDVHPGVVRIEGEKQATASSGQTGAADEKAKHVRSALEGLQRQRAAVELGIEESAEAREHTVEQNATAKIKELESEVEDALQSPSGNRAEKFRLLQERLAIKRLSPVQPGSETPTISTIVRHRGN